ncbi:MAG TPA: hypothetical protein P5214_10530 [Rectinema sp.]|nr:hypothetical protein [Rectinema sp.]
MKQKMISDIYDSFLSKKKRMNKNGETIEITGEEFIELTIMKILNDGGLPAVALLKELREAKEGR